MHNRKRYLVYPPNYTPGVGYAVCFSKYQAWKVAVRMGAGASVDVLTHTHPGRCKDWTSSVSEGLWGPLVRVMIPDQELRGQRKRPLPKIDVRADAGEVFVGGTTGGGIMQSPAVAAAAFQAAFFDVPEIQGNAKRAELEALMTKVAE